MSVEIRERTIGEIFTASSRNRYIVPRYQREYAWGREEICALLTDLWESFQLSSQQKYYLGTLVVKKRCTEEKMNVWEVIDGQQRLTTLTLLMRFIHWGSGFEPPLSFATRKSTNLFLADYCCGKDLEDCFIKNGVPQSFNAAVELIRSFRPSLKDGDEHHLSIGTGLLDEKKANMSFSDYIAQKVVMFEVVMPDDTDEMDYFEVMNNRGEQLEFHEMLKAELLAKLHELCIQDDAPETLRGKYDDLSHTFNLIWTACSKMDGHLIDHLHVCYRFKEDPGLNWTSLNSLKAKEDLDESGVPHERQSVIRDFSVFLMHILRLYASANKTAEQTVPDIPLDERGIKKVFDDVGMSIKINPVDFLQTLVIARLNYDKYVVKAKIENDTVVEWRLKEIIKRSNGKYEAKCTFGKGNEAAEDEHVQKKLVYLQAALQVSNASQRYKEWVYAILSAPNEVREDGNRLLKLLEEFAAGRIHSYRNECRANDRALGNLGLQTPRLLLNVIDYLMWNASEEKRKRGLDDEFLVPRNFVFGYQTSIEHHHAQCDDTGDDPWTQEQKDNIGNLYLTSNSENSSMGKHRTKEKVSIYRHAHEGQDPFTPKRAWMYEHTEESWPLEKMESLGKYVMDLVDRLLMQYPAANG